MEVEQSGHAVSILKYDSETHKFYMDEEALMKVVDQDHIKNLPVCLVSVTGAFRRGKSFLMDFFLRYLRNSGATDWLTKEKDMPLTGFHWRGGSERDTTGILIWSEVFNVTLVNGRRVGVVLMDTQGSFDSSSTVRDCATVFALSAMLSSVLVYNLTHNIQEDDLQHLQLFTEYGRLALENSGITPFQHLVFLVRDWSFPYEFSYGKEGGQSVLDKRLTISDGQHVELQSLRSHINSCFENISCFLMPHPGLNVATNPNFDGKLAKIEEQFLEYLDKFVPMLLSAENLAIKRIMGNEVKCGELVQYMKTYMEVFKGDELPEPKSMLEATAEANNLTSLHVSKELYISLMKEICGGGRPYVSEHLLEMEHERCRNAALETFNNRRKMGGDSFSDKYRQILENDINELYDEYVAFNSSKDILRAANTPLCLFIIAGCCYVLSQIFVLLGLYMLANVFNVILTFVFILLSVWTFLKYHGDQHDILVAIDDMALNLRQHCFVPLVQMVFNRVTGTMITGRHELKKIK